MTANVGFYGGGGSSVCLGWEMEKQKSENKRKSENEQKSENKGYVDNFFHRSSPARDMTRRR